MKHSFCFDTVNGMNSQQWFWNELAEMVGACSYDGIELPFTAWTFNAGRSGAPLCAVAIRTKFGSVKNYVDFLKECKIGGISSIAINGDNVMGTMFEDNVTPDHFYERLVELGKDTAEVLSEAGSHYLVVSPSPKIATMRGIFGQFSEEDRKKWFLDNAAAAINEISDYAKASGVKVLLRNEFYGLLRGNEITKLMDLVNEDVGFSPDLAHLQIAGATAAELIDKYTGRVECMKVNDTFYVDELGYFEKNVPEYPAEGQNQRVYCDLGNGTVDADSAYEAYKAAGGEWLCLSSKESFNHIKAMVKMQVFAGKHFN